MLISNDLMRHLSKFVEPPAELCLIRVLGSDHEFVFRVRCGEAHLDYPCVVPLFDSASKVEQYSNWDEVSKFCAVASAMVVPPDHPERNRHAGIRRPPQILKPMPYHQFPYRSF